MSYFFSIDGSYGSAEGLLILTDAQQALLTDDDWARIQQAPSLDRLRTARIVAEARLHNDHTCHEDIIGSTEHCVACSFVHGEPHCDVCNAHSDFVAWCGYCGNCVIHCAREEGCK